MNRSISQKLFQEAKMMFPGGVHSPVRAFKAVDGTPLFIQRGHGDRIWDADGNEYIDFCGSWGPLILGHADDDVIAAVSSQITKGLSYGAPSALGNELGRIILSNNKNVERIRFVSSGTEAVMSAVRLARGYTGKNKIVKFDGCYHGHLDSLLVNAGSGLVTFGQSSSAGVPESFVRDTLVLPLDNISAVERAIEAHGKDIAAIIIEPIPANNGLLLQSKEYLHFLRETTARHGILLIFDEVISGFRVGFEGAAGYFGIVPDLITYGKILGGGMPVGAFGGRADIMAHVAPEGPVYQAGTLSGNPVSMIAGVATLSKLISPGFYDGLHDMSQQFFSELDDILRKKGFGMQSIGSIFWIKFNRERIAVSSQIPAYFADIFKQLHAHLLANGVYLGPSSYEVGFLSSKHTAESLNKTLEAFESFQPIA